MREYHLNTPLRREDVAKLKVGDVVFVSGLIYTARDAAHQRALSYAKRNLKLPADLRGSIVYHCGPIVKKIGESWRIVAAGPTTSSRMDELVEKFIETFGVKMVIGKGGMGEGMMRAARKFCAAYGELTGGAAALAAESIRRVMDVKWLDLGTPEAIWVLEVEDLGPVLITIDPQGRNLRYEIQQEVLRRAGGILREL